MQCMFVQYYTTWYIYGKCYMCIYTHTYIHTCTQMYTLHVCSESAAKKKNTSKDLENLRMSAETDYILKFEVPLSLDQHLAK